MSSQLNVDTIVDKAGSGGSNVKMANTSTYVSDGGAVTQNTVQGLAKSWSNTEQASSYSTRDSFNLSSIADGGTGKTQLTFTNAFANANHASTALASNLNNFVGNNIEDNAQSTTTVDLCSIDGTNSREDASVLTSSTHGDLA